ncbi:hypothetical protein WN55_08241 [Dufourea novaeangliae]|uniref:Uncharacterized protein n=1 Tax=Dufourea novaeangliae TaxID=178035 RepID=A0A154P8L7_DUFNO|nr:hypothetical protein WN55_08241 [Dufourea novaeangliae]
MPVAESQEILREKDVSKQERILRRCTCVIRARHDDRKHTRETVGHVTAYVRVYGIAFSRGRCGILAWFQRCQMYGIRMRRKSGALLRDRWNDIVLSENERG